MAAQKKYNYIHKILKYKNTFTKQNIKTDYKLKLQLARIRGSVKAGLRVRDELPGVVCRSHVIGPRVWI